MTARIIVAIPSSNRLSATKTLLKAVKEIHFVFMNRGRIVSVPSQ